MKKIWKKISGYKTTAATLLFIANVGIKAFLPEWLTADQHYFIELIASIIGGAGITHKTIKEKDKINNAVKTAKKIITFKKQHNGRIKKRTQKKTG